MTYDLALYPASGPGLGHLMRCYALAEAAVEMGKKVVVVLDKPTDFGWPCPVIASIADLADSRTWYAPVTIADGPPGNWRVDDGNNDDGNNADRWLIVDSQIEPDFVTSVMFGGGGYIYPHFGATPISGYPTLYGEQWMPLRKQFREMEQAPTAQTQPAGYKVTPSMSDEEGGILPISKMSRANRVIVPASTVAYEALAAGRHVQLHDNVGGLEYIRDAMIEVGVAEMWPGKRLGHGQRVLDGLGAKRILEALL